MSHHHDHGAHGHGGGHHHAPTDFNRAFLVGVVLNVVFVGAEALAGWVSGSLALLSDAGHNASDVLGLLLAWGAATLASKRATARRTFGFRRATILAALGSAVLLFMAVGVIAWEAVERTMNPQPVEGLTVVVVAAIGVVHQRRDRLALPRREGSRPECEGRLPPHGGRRGRVPRGGGQRPRHPEDGLVLDRPPPSPSSWCSSS